VTKDKCDLCNGSGYYGDTGPGKKGNAEWQPCECSYRSDEKIIRSLGLRARMEGGLVIVNRECFNSFGEDYEIAFDQETLRALDRIATREMERQILDQK
jgi:hypothetical protein